MRLINTQTLELEEFHSSDPPTPPSYAILSHTWGPEEVSFSDYTSSRAAAESQDAYRKIWLSCEQARKDNISYMWIDTCCIDKSSSAELSESINSMYKWYQNSQVCYAYLTDVSVANFETEFPRSRWFTRGWTLQELIAPGGDFNFYDQRWNVLGSKHQHKQLISEITRIDVRVLASAEEDPYGYRNPSLSSVCAAKRMSWASNRETTRVEDMAYCLLGILGVNMPLLYGEGDRAFLRLQEEIIRKNDDDSILAWGLDTKTSHEKGSIPDQVIDTESVLTRPSALFAASPKDFENCHSLEYSGKSTKPFRLTNLGLQLELPILPVYGWDYLSDCQKKVRWIGLLSCLANEGTKIPGIVLWPSYEYPEVPSRLDRTRMLSGHHTFLVDVPTAVRATLTKITILQGKAKHPARSLCWGYRHTTVNPSEALRQAGY